MGIKHISFGNQVDQPYRVGVWIYIAGYICPDHPRVSSYTPNDLTTRYTSFDNNRYLDLKMAEENDNTSPRSLYEGDVNSQVSVSDDATELEIETHLARYKIAREIARTAKETAKSRMDEASERRDARDYETWDAEFRWEQHIQEAWESKIEATHRLLNRRQGRSAATNGDTIDQSSDMGEGAAPESSTSVNGTGVRYGAGSVDDMMPESLAGDERQRRSTSTTEPQMQGSRLRQRSEELATSAHHSRQDSVSDDSA